MFGAPNVAVCVCVSVCEDEGVLVCFVLINFHSIIHCGYVVIELELNNLCV